jgi:hypothetical protein
MIDDMLDGEQQVASSKPMLQDYKVVFWSRDQGVATARRA